MSPNLLAVLHPMRCHNFVTTGKQRIPCQDEYIRKLTRRLPQMAFLDIRQHNFHVHLLLIQLLFEIRQRFWCRLTAPGILYVFVQLPYTARCLLPVFFLFQELRVIHRPQLTRTSQIKPIGSISRPTVLDKKYIMRRACFGELAPVAQHKTLD